MAPSPADVEPIRIPRLSLQPAVTVTPVVGRSALCVNNTSYVAVVEGELVLCCAGANALGSTDGVRVLTLNPDHLAGAPREEWLATTGPAATPTLVARSGPVSFRLGTLAAMACIVQDGAEARVELFVLVQGPTPLARRWVSRGTISGGKTKCSAPSIAFDQSTNRFVVAFTEQVAMTKFEAHVVELDDEGTVLRGPTLLGEGKLPSVAAHDGWVAVAWKDLRKGATSDAETEVLGLYWPSDDWPPGGKEPWVPRVLAGPGGVDPVGQAKDPCAAIAGDNGRFWVAYDKGRGDAGSGQRDIGVVELYAGDPIDWRYAGVALQAQAPKVGTVDGADFAFGRGGLVGDHRLVLWESRRSDKVAADVGFAVGSSGGRLWRDDQTVQSGGAPDLLFPCFAVHEDRVFQVCFSGSVKATVFDGVLLVREATLSWLTPHGWGP